ncbi:hypothetical protein Cgig2_020720 [Carnegiea gigantea]|uniref:TFIIB-type domain-containing protein n=1 Tax=Carnegiea gigantea TaxID=171969 RepID=A0A9Q1JL58_9CARY|nr:hypothetical protein Cgig2_020720 [Carnegiea gigantea]
MADTVCYDCKRPTEVVFDHSTGDTICSECGLVLESHSIDETSEWRTFSNDSGADDKDPNRVGAAFNPLLDDVAGELTTVIAAGKGGKESVASLGRFRLGSTHSETNLQRGVSAIANMADKLNLVRTISDRASVIFKKFDDRSKSCYRGRNRDAVYAACLYIACQQENLPRTLKEICSVANGVTKTEIGRCKSAIMRELAADANNGGLFGGLGAAIGRTTTAGAGDYVKRFCSNLGIRENRAIRAAQEAARVSEEALDVRRTPVSVAAAVIYIVSQFSERRPLLKEISVATGVAEGTIRSAYKDLYPHVGKIVPSWFANALDLKRTRRMAPSVHAWILVDRESCNA